MKLSIIIPVYNEEKTIAKILRKVISVKVPADKEIIIINDGSKDDSESIIKSEIKRHGQGNGRSGKRCVIRYYRKRNGGKGTAVRYGLEKSTGDVLVIQDADMEYDPSDYVKLLKPIISGRYSVVYGSRYLSEKGHLKEHNHMTFKIHKMGNDMLSVMTSVLYFQRLTDMETCYKMFTREVLSGMKLGGKKFDIEPEITAKILKKGYKIKEVSIKYFSRDFAEGKKITWRDGVIAAWSLLKYRFTD